MINENEVSSKFGSQLEQDFIKPEIPLENRYLNIPLTEDTTCGIWFMKGPRLQKYANKKVYVLLYGTLGCIYLACYSYFTAIITTLEKRFKIPSKTTGFISIGNDFSQLFVSVFLSYYIGRGHRPRWIAGGLYCVVIFCLLTALPHVLYGPGIDALRLTREYGALHDANSSLEAIQMDERRYLCQPEGVISNNDCHTEEGNLEPQIIFFTAQIISGIGGCLYHTLGIPYMDDNIRKSKTPALLSFSYFLRMLGPAAGYTLASLCLKLYISPSMTPTIDTRDPRWLGAWWIGWFVLAFLMIIFATLIGLFPKTLPRAAARKALAEEKLDCNIVSALKIDEPTSFRDMILTFKRLLTNRILMLNNIASIFYFFGYMAYWIYLPKYIETQYNQSASVASLVTGTVGLVFSALGILLAGLVITRWRPSARQMAGWNVIVGLISVFGILSFAFLGCTANDNNMAVSLEEHYTSLCSLSCNCDYVQYSPVCSEDGTITFISPCHAGCRLKAVENGSTIYKDCKCIYDYTHESLDTNITFAAVAFPGSCSVDCTNQLYVFLAVVCLMKFSGATGRASNFLVSVRCVEEKDKPVSMGLGLMMISLFAFVPSPIFFGAILDKTCLVWGKTCTGNGNCWLYDGQSLRYLMNLIAASFVAVGTLFDFGVFHSVKHLKIFDDEDTK